MDVGKLKAIVELLEGTDVSRLEWQDGSDRLVIRRGFAAPAEPISPPAPAIARSPVQPSAAPPIAEVSSPSLITVVSPLVGTFYASPSPDEPPFVQIGQQIQKGQVLCIVEAMKLMNQIKAEVSGRLSEVLVKNAQMVEFDQPLFRVDPNG